MLEARAAAFVGGGRLKPIGPTLIRAPPDPDLVDGGGGFLRLLSYGPSVTVCHLVIGQDCAISSATGIPATPVARTRRRPARIRETGRESPGSRLGLLFTLGCVRSSTELAMSQQG